MTYSLIVSVYAIVAAFSMLFVIGCLRYDGKQYTFYFPRFVVAGRVDKNGKVKWDSGIGKPRPNARLILIEC